MSTVAPRSPAAPSPSPPLVDSEGFIDEHIRRTRRSLKLVDLASTAITLTVGTLAFLLVAAIVDHWIVPGGLGTSGRMVMFGLLIAGWGWYLYRQFGALVRSINPVYAAHTIERNAPSLKNSLLNVLLFRHHREGMPAKVYHALEQQAAQRLSASSAEAAIDHSALLRLGYVLLAVMAACVVYAILSPKNLATSVGRVIAPWADLAPPSRVQILDVQPGDASVALGERVNISAEMLAIRDDDPVRLRYTTADESQVDESIVMTRPASAGRFSADLPRASDVSRGAGAPGGAVGVQQDLEYWIEAGDARSRRFKLTVFERPTIVVQRVHYTYPAYTGEPSQTVESIGDLRGIEGTEVRIEAQANQDIKSAYVDFDSDGRSDVRMTTDGRTASATFKLQLREDRRTPWHIDYTLRLTTAEGRQNEDPAQYSIEVTPDYVPEVRITRPEEAELAVRADQQVLIGVEARDPDYAISQVRLAGRVGDRDLVLAELFEGNQRGAYKDLYPFVPGDAQLKPGDVLEYWAEARDSRQPEPNLAVSEHRRLRIVGPEQPGQGGQPNNNNGGRGEDDNQQGNQPGQDGGEGQQPGGGAAGGGQDGEKGQQGVGEQQGTGEQQGPGGQQDVGQQPGAGQGTGGGESDENQSSEETGGGGAGQSGEQQGQPGAAGQDGGPQQDGQSPNGQNSQDGGDAQRENAGADGEADEQAGAEGSAQNGQGGREGAAQRERVSTADEGEAFDRITERLAEEDAAKGQGGAEGEQPDAAGGRQGEGNRQQPGDQQQPGGEQGAGEQSEGPTEGGDQGPSDHAAGHPDGGATSGANAQREAGDPAGKQGADSEGETPAGAGADAAENRNNGQNAGAGAGQQGAPEASNKQPGENPSGDEHSQSGAEGEAPTDNSKGRNESDAHGDQGGDRTGEGKQGGGQKSENSGQGQPGSHEPSDTGQDQSQDPGAGQTGTDAGSEQTANGQTGRSSGNQPGNGSQTGDAGGEQPAADAPPDGEAASAAAPQGDNANQPPGGSSGNQSQPSGDDPGASGENNQGDPNAGEQPGQPGESGQPGNQSSDGDQPGDQAGEGRQPGESQPGSQQPGGENLPAGQNPPQSDPGSQGSPSGGAAARNPESGGTQGGGVDGDGTMSEPGGDQANLDYARKQTDLVIERLDQQLAKKQVDPELLKRLGWTEDELRAFVNRWKGLKAAAEAEGAQTGDATRALEAALRSIGLRPRDSLQIRGGTAQDNLRDLNDSFRARAPQEYADRVRAYMKGAGAADGE